MMDNFTSDHAMMRGFLNFQHNRRNTHSTQKRVHHDVHRGARSMSLLDRRGLITAPRFPSRKSSISPLPHHKRQDVDSADTVAMLMHLLEKDDEDDPLCAMFLPTVASTDRSTHTPVLWQHLQRTVPLPVRPFSQNSVGKVLLTLRYHLVKNRLIVDIIQVKDIAGRQNCDIFLSVQLLQSCRILERHETSSKRLAPNIYFKKTMEFNVPFALFYSNDTNLLIKVCQETKKADEIGHFVIGPQGNSTGVQHWRRIFSTPNISFSAWHTLTSAIRLPNKFSNCDFHN
uniref:C2 domain-containing protein n=1 Tax=Elaeophora elaphi TaxID=1147741 RepID=A0A0R3RII7_9BILA